MMPPKGFKNVSIKESLIRELRKIADLQETTVANVMHEVLWSHVNDFKKRGEI